jgi:PTH1 family peptidyl-tRNA hydrolase
MPGEIRLVIGLGNPGEEYEGTRHNVGFRVVERLARRAGVFFQSASALEGYRGKRRFRFARLDEPNALLVEPLTFMNLSGEAVAPLVEWGAVRPEHMLVVYDDLDLAPFELRIRPHGGAGGHNGMRSIVESLGTDRFPRLRVGIGRPRTDAARHVLEGFHADELEELAIAVDEAADAILFWLESGDLEKCMTRFHSRWSQDS